MSCNEEYFEQQHARVRKNYKSKHSPFGDKDKFADWYIHKLKEQECKCFYCKTSIFDINRLIDAGILKIRKVKGEGKRGPVLEVDKEGPVYNSDCILACYYCNNDKSYIASRMEYLQYFGENRNRFFKALLQSLN
jgi:uncharacterized Fe-S radical SAM superfamily protein PflX